jgi:YD repeat-containing protein
MSSQSPPRARKRRRAHETVPARDGELLDVAASMFESRGYADTSISDIAEALGIVKASVYHYIDSKEDLLYRICRAVHDDAGRIVEALGTIGGSPLDRLEFYVRELTASNARNVTKIAVYYTEYGRLTGERRTDIDRERKRHDRLVVELIEEGKSAGLVDPSVPTHVIAASVLAQVVWPYTWYRTGKRLSPEALGQSVAHLVMNALRSPTPLPVREQS